MKPIDKLHSVALTAATAVAFSFFLLAAKLIAAYPILTVISGGVISLVVYRGILASLLWVAKEFEWIKKKSSGQITLTAPG